MYLENEIVEIKNKLINGDYNIETDLFTLSEINNILISEKLSSEDENFFIEKYKKLIDEIEEKGLYRDNFEYLEYKAYFYFLNKKIRTLQTLIGTKLFKNNELILLLIELLVENNYNNEDVFGYVEVILENKIENIYIYRRLKSLLVGNYEYDLSGIDINSLIEYIDNSDVEIHPYELMGIWNKGYCLDEHTIIDGNATKGYSNSYAGGLMNKIKYYFIKEHIGELGNIFSDFLNGKYKKFLKTNLPFDNIDFIITTPPSKLDRPFQPVFEIAKDFSKKTGIPVYDDLLKKIRKTPQTKTISKLEAEKLLKGIFKIENISKFNGKNILIFDDLFGTGTTLNEIVKTIKEQTQVNKIFILTITKTRTSYGLRN